MQQHLDMGTHYYPPDVHADNRTHRYRSFMIEEILTEHTASAPAGELLKFGVQALLSARPFHSQLALKAEQTNIFNFPMSRLSCSLASPLGPPRATEATGLQVGAASHHRPLDLHLHGKMDLGEGGGKVKKGRRSRTVFTELQLMGLEKRFEKQKYLSTPDRIDLAESLGLSQLQVKTWYQNRRMKWKKIVLQGGGLESPTKPKGRPKKNSIPTSEQLSEQEQSAADAEQKSEGCCSHLEETLEE